MAKRILKIIIAVAVCFSLTINVSAIKITAGDVEHDLPINKLLWKYIVENGYQEI